MTIRKVRNRRLWNIYSSKGKRLNKKPYRNLKQAKLRLRQIEYFKNKNK